MMNFVTGCALFRQLGPVDWWPATPVREPPTTNPLTAYFSEMIDSVGSSKKFMPTLTNFCELNNRNCWRKKVGISAWSSPIAIFSACL
jgi:hypothetical protein